MSPLSRGGWTVERRSVAMPGPGFRRVAFPGPNQNAGEMVLRRVRGGWRLTGRAEGVYEVDLTIRSRGPGPTMVSRHPEGWGLLRRAMPVMDGTATGRLRQGKPMGETERIRGWRTTIVHDWWVPSSGCCPADPAAPVWPYPRCCADPDVAVAYAAGSATAVIGGWTKTAPNDDEGDWSGVIARRGGGRLSWCRARRTRIVHGIGPNRTLVPESMNVRGCGPRLRFRAISGVPERFEASVGGRRAGSALWLHTEESTTGSTD